MSALIIDGHALSDSERMRFMADLESAEGELYPPANEAQTNLHRCVSRDAVMGCAPMESEVAK